MAVDKSIVPSSSGKSTAATYNRKKKKMKIYIHVQCSNCAVLMAVDKSIVPSFSGKSTATEKRNKVNVYVRMQCSSCAGGS